MEHFHGYAEVTGSSSVLPTNHIYIPQPNDASNPVRAFRTSQHDRGRLVHVNGPRHPLQHDFGNSDQDNVDNAQAEKPAARHMLGAEKRF